MRMKGKTRVAFWVDDEDVEKLRKLSQTIEVPQSRIMDRGVKLALSWYEEREEMISKGSGLE